MDNNIVIDSTNNNAAGLKPIITKKTILIALAVFLVLFGVAAFFLLYKGPGQDMPDNNLDPQFNFASDDTKIAGIQVLITSGGLSRDQYVKVFKELDTKLPEQEPDAKYFLYVDNSLASSLSDESDSSDVVINYVPGGDGGETEYEADEPETLRPDMEEVDTVLFEMRSESGTVYKVSVYTAGGPTRADVTIEKQ